jgi:OmcA/MtrC family decaheme c-type cytochrome
VFGGVLMRVSIVLLGSVVALASCRGEDGALGVPGPVGDAGADGSTGPGGPDGPTGPGGATGSTGADGCPGPASGSVPTTLTITGVTINAGVPQVAFELDDQFGLPVRMVNPVWFRFTLAQLRIGTGGNPDSWQSYINTLKPAAADYISDGDDEVVATYELGADGTFAFVPSGCDGSWTFTFSTNITTVTSPVAVTYTATLTHRLGMELAGSFGAMNKTYTFQPSTGATTGIPTRTIVKTETCNTCHKNLVMHGSASEVEHCSTCHNPGSTDPSSDETLDMTQMMHRIHHGKNLPSVLAGGEFALWGGDSGNQRRDFGVWSKLPVGARGTNIDQKYPNADVEEDIPDCTVCHSSTDAQLTNGANWNTKPSQQACGSCHDTVNFATGAGHMGGTEAESIQTNNANCSTCHQPDGSWTKWTTGAPKLAPIAKAHKNEFRAALNQFQYEFVSIKGSTSNTPGQVDPGETMIVTFAIINPQTGDHYNLLTHQAFVGAPPPDISAMWLYVGWGENGEWHNYGTDNSSNGPASAMEFWLFEPWSPGPIPRSGTMVQTPGTTCPTDCTFDITLNRPLPALASGTGALLLTGICDADSEGLGNYDLAWSPVSNDFGTFTITDAVPMQRRQIVDAQKCKTCHNYISAHGATRNGDDAILGCGVCHNTQNTDFYKRAATNPNAPIGTPDGLKERQMDMKHLVHAMHAGEYRTTPFFAADRPPWDPSYENYSALRMPRGKDMLDNIRKCTNCHIDGANELPLKSFIGPSTLDSDPSAPTAADITPAALTDHDDDRRSSPTSTVCSACHDSDVSKIHMSQNGGRFDILLSEFNTSSSTSESCVVCHGPGKMADVMTVHGL